MTGERRPTTPERDSPETLARIDEGLDLVDILARQLRRQFGSYVAVEDLAGAGREALVVAARSFDPERGVPFRRWANLRVRGAMIDAVRSHAALPRRVYRQLKAIEAADRHDEAVQEEVAAAPQPATPEAADAKLGEQLSGAAMAMAIGMLTIRSTSDVGDPTDDAASPEEQVSRAQLLAKVKEAVEGLPDAERHLVSRHYFDGVNFDEAAREIGLSKSWASRLHARAIDGMARAMKRSR
jgi:RNA polymerase sigma factor FliA